MFRKMYIQLICVTKTRNGKLVALDWKQPLQEKLDIFSVLWNSVRSGKKGVFTRPNVLLSETDFGNLCPCMAWTNFDRPKTSRPWLYLTKHHKMSKRKLSFPDQSSIDKWLIKEKKIFMKHYLFNYWMI